jgi:hypothetical protein
VDHPSVFSFIASVISDSASEEKETTYLKIILKKTYFFPKSELILLFEQDVCKHLTGGTQVVQNGYQI